jgi:hypothetical protein
MRAAHAESAALLRLDRFVVLVAFLLLGTLALMSPLYVGISGMRTTGCQTACDTSLVGAGGAVIIAGCVGVTVIALLGLLALPRRHRYLWWLPCSALAIASAILVIGNHLIDLGVGA